MGNGMKLLVVRGEGRHRRYAHEYNMRVLRQAIMNCARQDYVTLERGEDGENALKIGEHYLYYKKHTVGGGSKNA